MAQVKVNRAFRTEMGRPENCRGWQREAGRLGKAAISANAPRRFGTLAGTIYVRFRYDGRTTVIRYGSPTKYAGFMEHGTGLYGPLRRYITPRRAKYLSWVDTKPTVGRPGGPQAQGPRIFAKRVRGSKPTRFMYRGLRETFGPSARSYASTGGKRGT